jgi:pyruvate formate lyase activating enzyme
MKALIFDIKRFAIHDGPGIRTTLFFKGCPLTCSWCHNPESRNAEPQKYEHIDKVGSKEFISEKTIGTYYTSEQLLNEVKKDKIFYTESGGGITCSGGEPLSQHSFLNKFLIECRSEGIHTALDTSGYAETKVIMHIAPNVDLFLFDIKHLDNTRHKQFAGVKNDIVLRNFKCLINAGYNVTARVPVIPEINAEKKYMDQLDKYLSNLICDNFNEVHLLPYHKIGCSKYDKFNIGINQSFMEPPVELLEEYSTIFKKSGFKTKIGG